MHMMHRTCTQLPVIRVCRCMVCACDWSVPLHGVCLWLECAVAWCVLANKNTGSNVFYIRVEWHRQLIEVGCSCVVQFRPICSVNWFAFWFALQLVVALLECPGIHQSNCNYLINLSTSSAINLCRWHACLPFACVHTVPHRLHLVWFCFLAPPLYRRHLDRTSTVLLPTRPWSWTRSWTTRPCSTARFRGTSRRPSLITSPRVCESPTPTTSRQHVVV